MTHKLLDKTTKMIIYRSAVRPITAANPNHRLEIDGGESSTSKKPIPKVPTVFIRSRQDDPNQGYHKIRVHLIFAVKYDGRHKARLVADGHLTPEPAEIITQELSR